jgi:tetratricopeptide (TPR) repeat protein
MSKGAITVVACSGLALAACAAPSVHVRAIADPAAKLRGGGDELAEARSMLALNSVGLALEGFRKAQIEQPSNPDVYVGMAQCYAAMGRYDLEGTNYEKALAFAPHDASILTAYANSLDHQGEAVRAAQVRIELAQATAPAMQAPQTGSLTVKLPPARPATSLAINKPLTAESPLASFVEAPARPEASAKEPIKAQVAVAAPAAALVPAAMEAAKPRLASVVATQEALASPTLAPAAVWAPVGLEKPAVVDRQVALAPVATRSPAFVEVAPVATAIVEKPASPRPPQTFAVVTVTKPQEPVRRKPDAVALAAELVSTEPVIKRREQLLPIEQLTVGSEPRLERLSIGEVALVTSAAPIWRRQVATAAAPRVAVQWLPIRTADNHAVIQLLNAARSQGLAAHTRMALADRGWRRIGIGNYREVRRRSLVLYSAEHAPTARRLAAQFSCNAVEVKGRRVLVVLLGRDAAARRAGSLRA